jgi:hypothetical protein
MKRKGREIQPLRVPLSPSALAIANQMMADYPNSEYLFPGDVPGKPLSDNATRALLIRMAYNAETTTTGFGPPSRTGRTKSANRASRTM